MDGATQSGLDAARRQEMRDLVASAAWKYVMKHLTSETQKLDNLSMRYDLGESLRLHSNGQRQAILSFIRWLYELAEVPHPYDESLGALYGRWGIETPRPQTPPKVEQGQRLPVRTRGRGAGTVA